jgi:hypothetical protein
MTPYQEPPSDPDSKSFRPRARFAPIALEQHFAPEEPYYTATSIQRGLLPSSLAQSPPGRSSTLPPAPRSVKPNRPRKPSVSQNARKGKHERQLSKDDSRRTSYDRKAYSAEPQTAAAIMGKRWEDLIDAAASATEEDSRDLTPVSLAIRCTVFQANCIGPAIAQPITSPQQSNIITALHGFTVPILHSLTAATCAHASATGNV